MTPKSLVICLSVALFASACAMPPRVVAPTVASEVGELRTGSGILKGYLAPADLPDSLALLPPPPAPGSPALAADVAAFQALTKYQATPRGAMAMSDADLSFPKVASVFACSLGVQVSEQATPNLNMLLRRSLTDVALSTYKAKDKYVRTRPFAMLKTGTCTPAEEAALMKDGSYPSGHAAVGWGWALLLTELAPERADALLQRGRAYAQSRGICGAHWQSDIDAGELIGAATVARLHANPFFNAQMAAAREEVAKARTLKGAPTAACTTEARIIGGPAVAAP